MSGDDRLCLALDVTGTADAVRWVERTRDVFGVYKIGLELFSAAGPAAIRAVRDAGARRIFLDLKLHDVPNTVAGAVRALAAHGVDLLTVHTAGGADMLRAAAGAAGPDLRLLGVTVLTSLDAAGLAAAGALPDVEAVAARRARLAVAAGVGGLVCSALEAGRLRQQVGASVLLVTPGLRLPGDAAGDQRRVATPAEAIAAGADLLVIGRSITAASEPERALAALSRHLEAG